MVAIATSGGGEDYSNCQLTYLLGDVASSLGSVSNVCDVVSSAFCCSGAGGAGAGANCAANEAAQELWGCAFEFYGCAMEDAVCADDSGVSSAPRRPAPGGKLGKFGVLLCLSCCCVAFFVLELATVLF